MEIAVRKCPVLLFLCLASVFRAIAHEAEVPGIEGPGFLEKPGARIPLDLPFFSETGEQSLFGKFLNGPTVLSIVYYRCSNACSLQTERLSNALRSFADDPATAPNILTVSFDPGETPRDARIAKDKALEEIQKPYPQDKWHFLTGGADSIRRLTDAVGFQFSGEAGNYNHPLGLIILSGDGEVVRYILGADFLPLDFTISLMEAQTGTIQPTIARIINFCFAYDPKNRRYAFDILKVSAVVTVAIVGSFAIYLVLSGRKRRQKGGS
jgi:protein SCO1